MQMGSHKPTNISLGTILYHLMAFFFTTTSQQRLWPGKSYNCLSLAQMDLGRASEALSAAHAALEIANELESQRLQANALQLISTVPCLPWLDFGGFYSLVNKHRP